MHDTIIALLEDKGLDMFVSTSWKYITCFGTLSLEVSDDLSAHLQPEQVSTHTCGMMQGRSSSECVNT